MHVLYSDSRIFNGRKQTLVDTIGILSALRMRGLHEKRHLLAKLRIAGSENFIYMNKGIFKAWEVYPSRASAGNKCSHCQFFCRAHAFMACRAHDRISNKTFYTFDHE